MSDTEEIHWEYQCHDCGCWAGQLHKIGCDMERCPKCGKQLIICGCFGNQEFCLDPAIEDGPAIKGYTRIPYIPPIPTCDYCGRQDFERFDVSDEEWKKFIVPEYQSKILCRECYEKMKLFCPDGWQHPRPVERVNES